MRFFLAELFLTDPLAIALDEAGLPARVFIGELFFEPSGFRSVKFEERLMEAVVTASMAAFLPELVGSWRLPCPTGEIIL